MAYSHCTIHGTYPVQGEPCWQCANPWINEAYEDGKKEMLKVCRAAQIAINDLISQLPNDERLATFNLDLAEGTIEQIEKAIAKAEEAE